MPPADRTPEQIAASVAKGRELFYSATKGNCMKCHGPTGLGDGQQDRLRQLEQGQHSSSSTTRTSLVDEIQELQKGACTDCTGEERETAEAEIEAKNSELARAPRR